MHDSDSLQPELKITCRQILGLAASVAFCCAGCGEASDQTRSTASGVASIGLGRATEAAALPPRSTARALGARRARHVHISVPAGAIANAQRGVSVWLPYWNMPAALDSTLANAGLVGTASPFWYAVSGDSRIEQDPGAGENSIIDALRGRGVRVIPTVTESEDMQDFARTLTSPSRSAAMVHALLGIATSHAYVGWDLDFEDFAVDPDHNAALADEAAARYPEFVAEVCRALHAVGRSCTVTIMPRTSDEHAYWRGDLATWVFDYGPIAKVADRVRVMAYDEHAPGGPPGPIASYPWVEQVIAYSAAAMPLDKVELGLAAYGYDWSGADAAPVTSRQAPQLASENGVSQSWNSAQAENTFHYTEDGRAHTVWYEGAAATYDRARLAKAAGFAGIDLWAAGDEPQALWPMLRSLYGG